MSAAAPALRGRLSRSPACWLLAIVLLVGALAPAVANGVPLAVRDRGAWSFPAVVTSISENDPIDGVATFTVEAKVTRQGLRQ